MFLDLKKDINSDIFKSGLKLKIKVLEYKDSIWKPHKSIISHFYIERTKIFEKKSK